MRTPRRLSAALLVFAIAATSWAQENFYRSDVSNAQRIGAHFRADYDQAPGQSPWSIQDDRLVHVYRATIDAGTITLTATLAAGTVPRTVLGPDSLQTLSIKGTAGSIWLDYHTGKPSEELAVSYDVPWNKAATIFSYPLFLAYDVDVSNLYATCHGTYPCTVHHTIVVLPSRAAIAIGGVELPRPTLLLRETTEINIASAGISPFAEWKSIALDGNVLTKIPFIQNYGVPPPGQWYRHPVREGDTTKSGDPLAPGDLAIPGSATSVEDFLSCGGGGCGTHQARIGIGNTLPTGLHTITLTTGPFPDATYRFYGTDADVGGADATSQLSTDFILFGPRVEVTPTQAGPGQTIGVRGSGFAPNSSVRIVAHIAASSRHVDLGSFETDGTGSFAAQPTLPPRGDVFFTDVEQTGSRPGSIQVDVDDPQFLADYFGGVPQYQYAEMTFVRTATVPTTTSTTLPGGGTNPPAGGLHPPACSATPVPPRAVQKFDAADQGLDVVEQMIAEAAARKGIRKLIGKADNALIKARQLVNRARKNGLVPESCASAAIDLINGLRARAQEARDNLKR